MDEQWRLLRKGLLIWLTEMSRNVRKHTLWYLRTRKTHIWLCGDFVVCMKKKKKKNFTSLATQILHPVILVRLRECKRAVWFESLLGAYDKGVRLSSCVLNFTWNPEIPITGLFKQNRCICIYVITTWLYFCNFEQASLYHLDESMKSLWHITGMSIKTYYKVRHKWNVLFVSALYFGLLLTVIDSVN